MNDWEKFTTKIIKAIIDIEPKTDREKIIKLAVLMYMYKSFESEETFNDNCEILNKSKEVQYAKTNKK